MSAAVAATPPPRPPPPAALVQARQQEVGGAGPSSPPGGARDGEERSGRRLSGEFTQSSESDIPPLQTRRRSNTFSAPSRRHTQHTPSPPPAHNNNSPSHPKPKPVRPPPPSRESLRKARAPPAMKRAHSVPRSSHASTAGGSTARGRPYSKSNVDVHRVRAKLSPEGAQQPETAAAPSQNGGVVSNGDHTQDPSCPSHSPAHSPTLETDSDLASNGGPPTFKSEDTPPRGCPEGQGPRSPVATSVREELPPVKPPRKKATSKSPSQSPAHSPAHSPPHQQKEESIGVSQTNSLAGDSGGVNADQPAIVPVETTNSSTPPEGSQTTGQTSEQRTSPADSTRPVIPPRPYRPPRPFPPPGKRAPPKARSPDAQTVPSEDGSEAHSKQQSPDRSTGSNDQVGGSHDQTVGSHDPQGSEAAGESRQNGSTNPELVEVPLATEEAPLVTETATGNKPEAEAPVQTRTLFELNEAGDEVPPLHSSSKSRGKKLFNSVRKGFQSLRVKRPDRQEETSQRSYSIGAHVSKLAPPTSPAHKDSGSPAAAKSETHTYPDPLPQGVINPLVVQCVAYLNRDEILKEEGLFRIPGDVGVIRKLRGQFVSGQDVDLSEILDPHTVTGLLKVHFREQRVSLIPRGQPLADISLAVKARDLEAVRRVLSQIAILHIATLRVVTEVLKKVVEFSEMNQMTSGSLATSCGPSLFPYLPPSNANALLKFLIDHCSEIFQE